MNWTTEYPTKPGYYWLRNLQRDTTRGPVVVEVDSNLEVRFAGCELLSPRASALHAEWCGPIQPPADNPLVKVEQVPIDEWLAELNADMDERNSRMWPR